jgi:hypothetical protein
MNPSDFGESAAPRSYFVKRFLRERTAGPMGVAWRAYYKADDVADHLLNRFDAEKDRFLDEHNLKGRDFNPSRDESVDNRAASPPQAARGRDQSAPPQSPANRQNPASLQLEEGPAAPSNERARDTARIHQSSYRVAGPPTRAVDLNQYQQMPAPPAAARSDAETSLQLEEVPAPRGAAAPNLLSRDDMSLQLEDVPSDQLKAEKALGFSPQLEGFSPEQKTAFYATVNKVADSFQRLDIAGRGEEAMPNGKIMSSLIAVDDLVPAGGKPDAYLERFSGVDKAIAAAEKNLTPELQRQNKQEATRILGGEPDLGKLSPEQQDGYYQRVVRVDHLMKEGAGSQRAMAELAKQQTALKEFPAQLASQSPETAWKAMNDVDRAALIVNDPNPEKLRDNKSRAAEALRGAPKLNGFSQEQKDAFYAAVARGGDAVKVCIVQGRTRDAMELSKEIGRLAAVDDDKTKTPADWGKQYAAIDSEIAKISKLDEKTLAANQKQAVKILGEQPDLQKLSPDQQAGFYARVVTMDALVKNGVASDRAKAELNKQNDELKAIPARLRSEPADEVWKSIDKVDQAQIPINLPEKQQSQSRFGRAWQNVKDAGSRAVDAIGSVPDRISAQFSSAPPAAPQNAAVASASPKVAQSPPVPNVQALNNNPDRGPSQPPPREAEKALLGYDLRIARPNGPSQPPPAQDAKDGPLPPLPNFPPKEPLPSPPGKQPPEGNARTPNQPPDVDIRYGPNHQPKGPGTQLGGRFEGVDHKDGIATAHLRLGSHREDLTVDERSPAGKAVGEALDHIHEGDQFSMKIGNDATKHEVVEIVDKNTGSDLKIHSQGEVEKVVPQAPQLNKEIRR